MRTNAFIILPNVQDEPRPWLARLVLLGARGVTAMVVGSGALLGRFSIYQRYTAWSIRPQRQSGLPHAQSPRMNYATSHLRYAFLSNLPIELSRERFDTV